MSAIEMPYAVEAEICVVGALFLDPAAAARAMEMLVPESFYLDRHRIIFRAMAELFARDLPIDPSGFGAHLQSRGELEAAGGMAYLGELLDAVPTAAAIEYHCNIVREHALLRALIGAGTRIVHEVHNRKGRPVSEIIDTAQQLVYEATEHKNAPDGLTLLKRSLMPALSQIERYQNAKGGMPGVPSGLYDLDEMTGGWRPGQLIVIGARAGMGKTSLVTGCALHAAITEHVPVALFSMEMTKEEIVERMLCHEAIVDLNLLRRGKLRDDDFVRLASVSSLLNTAPIWIDDSGSLSVMQLRAKARRLKLEQPNLGLIIVDYIQMMTADAENRTQEISVISRGLKAIAKELRVPVIALSQLSRKSEERGDRRPFMSDLRESGSIEQDADIVCLVHRPEYYFGAVDSKGNNVEGHAELIIGKQRNGPTGTVTLFFRKESARFESMSQDWKGNAA